MDDKDKELVKFLEAEASILRASNMDTKWPTIEERAAKTLASAARLRELVEENARLEKQYRERRDVPMENIARIAAKPAKAKGVGCD